MPAIPPPYSIDQATPPSLRQACVSPPSIVHSPSEHWTANPVPRLNPGAQRWVEQKLRGGL
jgi:hypothetical protein